jgi:hypothetical protein
VKKSSQERSSIFQGKRERPIRGSWPPLLLLCLSLLAAHFLNVILQWTCIRSELAGKPSYHTPDYSFLGFSMFSGQKIAGAQRLPNASPGGRIFAYFDFLHPAVFMVWNNGEEEDFFDLGPLLVAVPPGSSHVTFFPGSVLVLRHGGSALARNYGGSILGGVWSRSLNEKSAALIKGNRKPPGSFVVKPVQGSLSQTVPYLVYFFLPLVVIVILIIISGSPMAAAFFYYAGMFFLFDHQKLFVTAPFAWVFKVLGVELPDPRLATAIAAFIALVFLGFSVFGLWRWKNREMSCRDKWVVLFFVFLPFFLFF